MSKSPKGLGDKIEGITKATGIKAVVDKISEVTGIDCGCEERKRLLNERYPNFKNIRPFTKDEKKVYEAIIPTVEKQKRVTRDNQMALGTLYLAVFKTKAQWANCGPCTKRTIDNLKRVYEKSCEV